MPTTDLVLNAFYPVCECVVYSTYACIAVFHAITKIFIKAGVTIWDTQFGMREGDIVMSWPQPPGYRDIRSLIYLRVKRG